MEPWNPSSEPPDPREQPECVCTLGARASPECYWHAWRSEPVYAVIRLRDAAGTPRTGHQWEEDEDEDVKF